MIRAIVVALAIIVGLAGVMWVVGMMLPVGHVASGTRVLPRPADAVYRLVSSVEEYPRWWPDVSHVEVLARDDQGRVTFRQHSSDGPIVMQVVEQTPPTRFVTRIADAEQPFGGTWTFDVEPQGESARLTITERGEVYNPLFRFLSRFVFGHTGTIESFLSAALRATNES